MKPRFLFVLSAVVAFAVLAPSQQPKAPAQPQTVEQKLDRVFQEWERPDRPGGVAAVIEKGKVIYKKCFGQANVEYQIATTPKTAFDVGQLAEVITGMAIATLEEQGKLAAADPVKKYLTDLPSYADGLTLAHLIHHTSGLPDWYELMTAAGWNDGDVITLDQVHKIMKRQKGLLFEPGAKALPSRTDYLLLAEVVRRAMGQSLRDWTWTNIFKPLGMTRTLFRDSYREVIENRAYSINYHYRDGDLKGADNLGAVGSLGLFTTLDDFIKWVLDFENPSSGSAGVKEKMLTSGKLADGGDCGYSYGFLVDTYKGVKRVHKSGSWGGFRIAFRHFPAASLTIFVFANWDYNWNDPDMYVDGAADVCLEPLLEKPQAPLAPSPKPAKPKPSKLSPEEAAQYIGEYRSGELGYIFVAQEKGAFVAKAGSETFPLVPAGPGRLAFADPNIPIVLTFSKGPDGKVNAVSFNPGTGEITAPKVERETLTADMLKPYEGSYYCEELDARYEIFRREGGLALTSLRARDINLNPENPKTFISNSTGFPVVSFSFGEKGEVTGFRVESDSLRLLVFRKI
jgi:CubicO group peptidase (beta-lactamase class C family)